MSTPDTDTAKHNVLAMACNLDCDVGSDPAVIEFDFGTMFPGRTHDVVFIIHPDLVHLEETIKQAIATNLTLAQQQGQEFDGDIFHQPGVLYIGLSRGITHAGSQFIQISTDTTWYAAICMGVADVNDVSVFHEACHMAHRLFVKNYRLVEGSAPVPDRDSIPFETGDFSFASWSRWYECYWLNDPEEFWVNQCYRKWQGLTQHTDQQVAMITHGLVYNYNADLINYGMPRREVEKLVKQVIFNRAHPQDIRYLRSEVNRSAKVAGVRV